MATQLIRKPNGEWVISGDTDADLDRGIAAIERNIRSPQSLPAATSTEQAASPRRRGRPSQNALPQAKAARRAGMMQVTLTFLSAIQNAEGHRLTSQELQRVLNLNEPRAVGPVAMSAQRCLAELQIPVKDVFESVRTAEGRFWVGRPRLAEAIATLAKRRVSV